MLRKNRKGEESMHKNTYKKPTANIILGFPGGSVVKNLPAMQEVWVQSLGQEDPLEKEMETHSSILSCLEKSDGQKSMVGYSPCSLKESATNEHTQHYT